MMTRALIVLLDALRPEFVTPELMPNLHAFAARGVRFLNARATFPTETRVNQSAVTTGCYPCHHGVVANRFPLTGPEAMAAPGAVLNTGRDEDFERSLARLPGRLLGVPSLGEILAAEGKRLATISAGTSGGGRLINLQAEKTGGFRLALRRPEAAVPDGVFESVEARLGPRPGRSMPGLALNTYAVDCYLDHVEPEVRPDVMLLWLSEPDEGFHYCGIGSPKSLDAIRHIDSEVGRILRRQAGAIEAGELQVVVMSDHGQISLDGGKIDMVGKMKAAGFRAASAPGEDVDCVVAVHNAGGIWVRDGDPELTGRLVEWLVAQAWCGPLFTRDGLAGTLAHAEIMTVHPRAADVVLALAHRDDANRWGRAGLSADNAPYPENGGCHGGLSNWELSNFIAISGSVFRESMAPETPAGNVDIMPTVLAALDITIGHKIDGRVLSEALARGTAPAGSPRSVQLESEPLAGRQTCLAAVEFGGVRYLDEAWAE